MSNQPARKNVTDRELLDVFKKDIESRTRESDNRRDVELSAQQYSDKEGERLFKFHLEELKLRVKKTYFSWFFTTFSFTAFLCIIGVSVWMIKNNIQGGSELLTGAISLIVGSVGGYGFAVSRKDK